MEGRPAVFEGETIDDIIKKAAEHAHVEHGIADTTTEVQRAALGCDPRLWPQTRCVGSVVSSRPRLRGAKRSILTACASSRPCWTS